MASINHLNEHQNQEQIPKRTQNNPASIFPLQQESSAVGAKDKKKTSIINGEDANESPKILFEKTTAEKKLSKLSVARIVRYGTTWQGIIFFDTVLKGLSKIDAVLNNRIIRLLYLSFSIIVLISYFGFCIYLIVILQDEANGQPIIPIILDLFLVFLVLGHLISQITLAASDIDVTESRRFGIVASIIFFDAFGILAAILIRSINMSYCVVILTLLFFCSMEANISMITVLCALPICIIFLMIEMGARIAICQLECPREEKVVSKLQYYAYFYQGDKFPAIICMICLEDFAEKESVCILNCHISHLFHENCLLEWLAHKYVCPICQSKADFYDS